MPAAAKPWETAVAGKAFVCQWSADEVTVGVTVIGWLCTGLYILISNVTRKYD